MIKRLTIFLSISALIFAFFFINRAFALESILHLQVGNGSGNSGSKITPMPIDQVAGYFVFDTYISPGDKNTLLAIIAPAFGSKQFVKLLMSGGNHKIHVSFYTKTGNTIDGGANYDNNTMKFWGFWDSTLNKTMKAHIFVHELGHLLDRRNNRISDRSYNRTSLAKSDSSCYNAIPSNSNKYISTYAYRDIDGVGGGANHESFAESLANYVFCKPGAYCDYNSWQHSSSIVFNGKCPATYSWFKANIFGGDDFFSGGNSNINSPTANSGSQTNSISQSSSSDCSGYYRRTFSKTVAQAKFKHKKDPNFGDPNCELASAKSRDLLYSKLKSTVPGDANKWFYTVVPCESSYNPNNFTSYSASGRGAYGLFQMNPKGTSWSPLDAGDVVWTKQLANATDYNAMLAKKGLKWRYWACARSFW